MPIAGKCNADKMPIKRRNPAYKLVSKDIKRFNTALSRLNLTKVQFCKHYNLNIDTFRNGLSHLKVSQEAARAIFDVINGNFKQDSISSDKTNTSQSIYSMVKSIYPKLYQQIINPANAFLTLSHSDGVFLSSIANKIIVDAVEIIISVGELQNKETDEFIVIIVIRKINKDKLIEVCGKYVGNVEVK